MRSKIENHINENKKIPDTLLALITGHKNTRGVLLWPIFKIHNWLSLSLAKCSNYKNELTTQFLSNCFSAVVWKFDNIYYQKLFLREEGTERAIICFREKMLHAFKIFPEGYYTEVRIDS